MKKVLIIYETTSSGYQEVLAKNLAAQYGAAGYEAGLLCLAPSGDSSRYSDAIDQASPDLVVTLDLAGFYLLNVIEDPFYDNLFCPFIHLVYCDPLFKNDYLWQRLNATMRFYFCSRDASSFAGSFYTGLPHAGFLAPVLPCAPDPKPFDSRSRDLLCPWPYESPAAILDRLKALPGVFRSIALDCAEAMLKDTLTTLPSFLENRLRQLGIGLSVEEFTALAASLSDVGSYVRTVRLSETVKSLLAAGRTVRVMDRGWTEVSPDTGAQGLIHVLPSPDPGVPAFLRLLRCMDDVRFVLDYPRLTGLSQSPLSFCAMTRGSAALAVLGTVFEPSFKDGEALCLYDPASPASAVQAVESYEEKAPRDISGLIHRQAGILCGPSSLLSVTADLPY